jgi:hypothetical protein
MNKKKRQEAVEAYALAVGRLSIAWNYLHGALGDVFALVSGGDDELVKKWRSIPNDSAQRQKLRTAINAANPDRWKQTRTAPADLLWILERTDDLSIVRNDAMHAPVMLHIGAEIVEVGVALHTTGDERERRLLAIAASGRKLLDEFAKCEQDIDALSVFVLWATAALAEPDRQEWPTPLPKQFMVSPGY